MRTKTKVCQKHEWSACGPKHALSGKLYLPDWSVGRPMNNALFILGSPQVTIATFFFFFFSCTASVVLIWPKITKKSIQNGGNHAESLRKAKLSEIIYLNEYLSNSSVMKDEFQVVNEVH